MTSKWNSGHTATTWIDGDILRAADVSDTLVSMPFRLKTIGTITTLAATTTYDVDYVDIDFAAGELLTTDLIRVELIGSSSVASGQTINYRIDLENTTSNPTGQDVAFGGGANTVVSWANVILAQDPTTNTQVDAGGTSNNDAAATANDMAASLGSGDANVFTTAFSVRINTRHTVAPGTNAITRYKVYILS